VTEKDQILRKLEHHRQVLREVLSGVSEEDANARPTASALSLAGILKHVIYGENGWIDFVVDGKKTDDLERYAASFQVKAGETVASLLDDYAEAARRTADVIAALPDLDIAHRLPEAPWYPPDAEYSAREVLLHILAETAHHTGHADIIKETLVAA
jgi:uncharacterized damage-inducible protein DinB